MDAEILRLILLLIGVLVVLGIYFWDHAKRTRRRQTLSREQIDAGEHRLDFPAPVTDDNPLGALDPEPTHIDRELDQLGELLADAREPIAETEPVAGGQQELFDPPSSEPLPEAGSVPTKILQINVVSKRGGFKGDAIVKAVKSTGLVAGEMSIFHRLANRSGSPVVFGLASMVEPGSFPINDMSGFSTPGLTLFAQLPAPMEGLALFSDMVFTAQSLATALDGELQDETHSALTRQTIEHKREEILEFRRQIELARRKA